jgi:hypothetical protein
MCGDFSAASFQTNVLARPGSRLELGFWRACVPLPEVRLAESLSNRLEVLVNRVRCWLAPQISVDESSCREGLRYAIAEITGTPVALSSCGWPD